MRAARNPTPGAVALKHKLAPTQTADTGTRARRMSSSAGRRHAQRPRLSADRSLRGRDRQPAPTLERRGDPQNVAEVLRWAGEPLATAEVAAVCSIELDEAREPLGRVATEAHIGFEGLWQLHAI